MSLPPLLSPQDSALFTSVGVVEPSSVSANDIDVLLVNGQTTAVGTAQFTLRGFMQAGGGMLVGAQTETWGNSATKPLITHPINQLLGPVVRHRWGRLLRCSSPVLLPAN